MAFKPKVQKIELENEESDIIAVIDADWPVYSVASVGDDDYIVVTHTESGTKQEFKNVTEFKGRSNKVLGGWLAERNIQRSKKKLPLYSLEDFTIEACKKRKVEYDDSGDPLSQDDSDRNIFHSAKSMIMSCLNSLGAGQYVAYHGGSGLYRLNRSTLMEYKGNRKDVVKPIMFPDVLDYIVKRFKSEKVKGDIETDDMVVMVAYQKPNHVVVGVDKDFRGQPIKFFDYNNQDEGIIDGDCFGELEWYPAPKNKVSGFGRLFMYYQMLSGDATDNYKTNCFSDTRWGAKSVYDSLVDCKDDHEAWVMMVRCMKNLYPEPIKVKGWRQKTATLNIDWLYVLNEMFVMARMLRFEGDDKTTMQDWMKELGLNPDRILV